MTPLPQPLLAAVIASPDDDVPRLLAADWWEENGEPERAEFVRVQCELASPRYDVEKIAGGVTLYQVQQSAAMLRRQRELHEHVVYAGNNLPVGVQAGHYVRGFIESVTLTWADWQRHADALRAATPLREVWLTTEPHVEVIQSSGGVMRFTLHDHLPNYSRRAYVQTADKGAVPAFVLVARQRWPGITFRLPHQLDVRNVRDVPGGIAATLSIR